MSELTVTEVLAAPLARVYAAWTEPERMRRWFGKADMSVPEASVDLRLGGRWRVVLLRADGVRMPVGGEYREILPEERLRFSWQWEGSEVVTEVELRFRALDAARTELTVIHSEFPDESMRDQHFDGWRPALANLSRYLDAA